MWINWIRNRDSWEKAFLVLLGIGVIVVAVTFQSYGVSYDDEFSRHNGADFIRWYTSGFRDRAVLTSVANEYLYGHFFNAPAVVLAYLSPLRPYETQHLAVATVGLLGLFVVFRLGKHLGGSRVGFVSALILALTPAYYGHSFINPKDLPFAVFYLTALYFLLRLYDRLPRPGFPVIAATGVALGLPLSIRVGGVMLLGYVGVLALFWHVARARSNSWNGWSESARDIRYTAPTLIGICVIAWIVMVVWWPFAQMDPVRNPLDAISKTTNFGGAGFTNLYGGEFIKSSMLPRGYLPDMLVRTLPEFYGVGIVASVAAAIYWLKSRKRAEKGRPADTAAKLGFFVFTALFPIAAAVAMRPTVYDGTRLFLFVIPPFAVLASLGLNWFFLLDISPGLKRLAGALLIVIGGMVVMDMLRSHPYQYAYFNRASGGLPAAYGRYDTDYWGTSYKEGVEWLARHYKPDAAPSSIGVGNPTNPFLTAYYVESGKPETRRFRHADMKKKPDVVLSITRWNHHLMHGGKVLHVVRRMGTPLLYVIESNSTGISEDSTMKVAIERLYVQRDAAGAAQELSKVLQMNSAHYGAISSLAFALERSGQAAQARSQWTRVLTLAVEYNDQHMVQSAMRRLH